jgi:metal-responsive CopG/Arc/MetJ family transcriptional regulator
MVKNKTDTTPVHIRLSDTMVEGIDLAVKLGQGNNRSDIIKIAIANYLKELTITNEMKKSKL